MSDEQTTGTADELPHENPAVVQAATVVAGEPAEVVERGSGFKRRWRSKKQMQRSKAWRQIAPIFTAENQERLVQEVLDRLYPKYLEDIKRRAAQEPEDELMQRFAKVPPSRPIRQAIVVPLPQKFWLEKIATLRTTRLQMHVQLKSIEDQINAAQQMLDTTRFPPNGPAAA